MAVMRAIYAKSKRVYIWLGLETESSKYAMDWIREVSLGKYPLLGVKFRNFPANMVYPSELAKLVRIAPELIKGGKLSRRLVYYNFEAICEFGKSLLKIYTSLSSLEPEARDDRVQFAAHSRYLSSSLVYPDVDSARTCHGFGADRRLWWQIYALELFFLGHG